MRLSRAQILWGMFYNKNVDFVALLWEDFAFQIENRDYKKQDKMYYPRFTKAIIHHLISKDKSISMRNRIFMHTVRDDRMTSQQMWNSPAYKTYLAFATGAATPKKARKFKKPASPSKKKARVAVEEPTEKPETNIHQAGGSSEEADLESEVPDEPKGKSIDTNSDDGDDDDDQQNDDESTKSDDDKSVNLNKTDNEKEDEFVHTPDDYVPTNDQNVDDEEYERINKEMYDEVNVKLKDAEPANKENGDEEMAHAENLNAEHEEVSQEVAGNQVKDDAQPTVTAAPATQKTEVPLQSSSISFGYAIKFLNFDNILSGETEIISMMDFKVQHEDPTIQTSPLLTVPVMVIPESLTASATTIPSPISPFIPLKTLRNVDHSSAIHATIKSEVPTIVKEYLGTNLDDTLQKVIQRHAAELIKEHFVPADVVEKRAMFETITTSKTFNKHPKHKDLYHPLMEYMSIIADEDVTDKGVADIQKKRKPYDADRDEDPPT
ncbi:hypothetical protein Tco_0051262 [Tanacetum coccineum]